MSDGLEKLKQLVKKDNSIGKIEIGLDELPTAIEIVEESKKSKEILPYLEKVKYLPLNPKMDDLSRSYLVMFLDNCEKEFSRKEQKDHSNSIKTPVFDYIVLGIVAILLLVASIFPFMHNCFNRNDGIHFKVTETEKVNDSNSEPEKHHSIEFANWSAIVGFSAALLVYLVFYVMLTMVLFKTLKSIRQHHRRKLLHNNLASLASVLSIKVDPTDVTHLETRKRLLKVLLPSEDEE